MNRWPGRLRALLVGFGLALCALVAAAQGLLSVPALSGHVIDTTHTLSLAQQQAMDTRLRAFEAASGSQLVVLIVPTTLPEDMASYANRVGNTWKIGRKEVGDGLLLVVAKDDRKLRIEVAKALEGAVPDLAAQHIIDEAISPRFRQGDFAGGINAGLDLLTARIQGEALPAPRQSGAAARTANEGFQWMDLVVFMFFAVPIGGSLARQVLGNRLGSLLTGGGVGAAVMVVTASLVMAVLAAVVALGVTLLLSLRRVPPPGYRQSGAGVATATGNWGSGSNDPSAGGGGFSSGGGGDFGGGGASGDW